MSSEGECLIAEFESIAAEDVGLKVLELAEFSNETVSFVTRNNQQEVSEIGELTD
jgi:hypothetical protein